eukprot:scaffold285_cov304-Pinguiococcus_pyrenoidosus.AAC.8
MFLAVLDAPRLRHLSCGDATAKSCIVSVSTKYVLRFVWKPRKKEGLAGMRSSFAKRSHRTSVFVPCLWFLVSLCHAPDLLRLAKR